MVAIEEDHHEEAKAKMVKNQVKVAKQLETMVVHEVEILREDVDVFLNEISVNVKVEMIMQAMVIKRMAKMVPMVTHVVQESHASAHAIDQIRIAVATK